MTPQDFDPLVNDIPSLRQLLADERLAHSQTRRERDVLVESIQGLAEAWRDEAADERSSASRASAFQPDTANVQRRRAMILDDCADEIEAELKKFATQPAQADEPQKGE